MAHPKSRHTDSTGCGAPEREFVRLRIGKDELRRRLSASGLERTSFGGLGDFEFRRRLSASGLERTSFGGLDDAVTTCALASRGQALERLDLGRALRSRFGEMNDVWSVRRRMT